ncbi:hypothetical protein ACFWXO_16510 [Kitasatospora sp. NPDC059088]|uniref:hypothetical protein n=1 Tax=Kitasatospora sp. NPDC059088 TaxID=3346722 RepID=UPI0036966B47
MVISLMSSERQRPRFLRPVWLTPRRRPVRLLVDGLDLVGKTTLVDELMTMLGELGVPARRHQGLLAQRHPLRGVLDRLPVPYHRNTGVTAAHLIAGFAVDAVLARIEALRPASDSAVLVQDSYVDRTIAAGLAEGPFLSAAIALWAAPLFPRFHVAAYLHAEPAVRRARLQDRDLADIDEGDRRTVEDEGFARRFNAALLHHLGHRHGTVLVFDTGDLSPREIARRILAAAGLTASQEVGHGRA